VALTIALAGAMGAGELSGSVRNLTRVTLPESGGRKLARRAIRAWSLQ
jgi:hypothetical protein